MTTSSGNPPSNSATMLVNEGAILVFLFFIFLTFFGFFFLSAVFLLLTGFFGGAKGSEGKIGAVILGAPGIINLALLGTGDIPEDSGGVILELIGGGALLETGGGTPLDISPIGLTLLMKDGEIKLDGLTKLLRGTNEIEVEGVINPVGFGALLLNCFEISPTVGNLPISPAFGNLPISIQTSKA